jgi:hypothetical protein
MMKTTLKITAAILAAWTIVGYLEGPAEAASRWTRDKQIVQPDAIPGIRNATAQYRREYKLVNAMLAKNPNAFDGFNKSNTLAELRAQVDANIRERHARELAAAATTAAQARLLTQHASFWKGLAARRQTRTKFTDEQNIVHSLMMIFTTRQKLMK